MWSPASPACRHKLHRAVRVWLAASEGVLPLELRSAAVRCFFFFFAVTTPASLVEIYIAVLMFASRWVVINSVGLSPFSEAFGQM